MTDAFLRPQGPLPCCARIAANASWAATANRSERAAKGHRASPVSIDYWRAWARDEYPEMSPGDQLKAATNKHSEHMQRMAKKAVEARARRRAKQAGKGEQPAA
ncbi:hypothetical protein BJF79_39665 [Actinomadura sp. CNU-125]|uniref:hypothetical protein n=1 Tax=Actinomadura sp. CNU-125 TaxID=1904961 RepID=UPI00095E0175|nr:hypothetical protein [Actinomadura sp. CNU-125]OLT30070.1 hypothetical protein BJF79_39665 [Actinomadura sp. CNU-125]